MHRAKQLFNEFMAELAHSSRSLTGTGRPGGTEVRDKIVAAACTEFAALGRKASVRAIGTRAGVTAAMINYYFGSKDELYEVVIAEAQARLFSCLAGSVQASPKEELASQIAGAYFDFLAEEREFQRLLLHEVLAEGPGLSKFVVQYVEPLRSLFGDLFGHDEEIFQSAVSLFGAVAGYFIYEPAISLLIAENPRDKKRLAARRKHIQALASRLSQQSEN